MSHNYGKTGHAILLFFERALTTFYNRRRSPIGEECQIGIQKPPTTLSTGYFLALFRAGAEWE